MARTARNAGSFAVLLELCPSCHSQDVRAIEPGFFVLELDRADQVRSTWVEDVEFSCRACGIIWH